MRCSLLRVKLGSESSRDRLCEKTRCENTKAEKLENSVDQMVELTSAQQSSCPFFPRPHDDGIDRQQNTLKKTSENIRFLMTYHGTNWHKKNTDASALQNAGPLKIVTNHQVLVLSYFMQCHACVLLWLLPPPPPPTPSPGALSGPSHRHTEADGYIVFLICRSHTHPHSIFLPLSLSFPPSLSLSFYLSHPLSLSLHPLRGSLSLSHPLFLSSHAQTPFLSLPPLRPGPVARVTLTSM